jgi:hypothetical protein
MTEQLDALADYVTAAACLFAFFVFRVDGSSRATVLDTIDAVRWLQLILLLVVLCLARRWDDGGMTVPAAPLPRRDEPTSDRHRRQCTGWGPVVA